MVILLVTSVSCCVVFIYSQNHSKFMLCASSLIPQRDSCLYPELCCFWAIAAFVLLLWLQLFLVCPWHGRCCMDRVLCCSLSSCVGLTRHCLSCAFWGFSIRWPSSAFREAVEVCTEGATELLVGYKLLPPTSSCRGFPPGVGAGIYALAPMDLSLTRPVLKCLKEVDLTSSPHRQTNLVCRCMQKKPKTPKPKQKQLPHNPTPSP